MLLLLLFYRRPLPAYYVPATNDPHHLVEYFLFSHVASEPDRRRLCEIVDSLESDIAVPAQLSALSSLVASGSPDASFILGVVSLFGLFNQPIDDLTAHVHLMNAFRAGHFLAPPLLLWMSRSSLVTLPIDEPYLWGDPYVSLAKSASCEATRETLRAIVYQWDHKQVSLDEFVGGPFESELYERHLFDQAETLNRLWQHTVSREEYFDFVLGHTNRSELPLSLARVGRWVSARPPTGIREIFDYLDRPEVGCSLRLMGHFKRLTLFAELLRQAEEAFVAQDWQYLGQATYQLVG
jgi:hypothetical protein